MFVTETETRRRLHKGKKQVVSRKQRAKFYPLHGFVKNLIKRKLSVSRQIKL